ncbi:MAG TPA: Gfo/Idh/MocA family oxidoreductase [Syntrophorhabdaceae bacterium]|nr:Gfo/Idh/MocA family oxidoreductase [Syntrophorhabdaceae bacterium]HQM80946.1 Gfo/Idh/MocA family oxidoreductase [Syntrophorhabdaceae bacterium]
MKFLVIGYGSIGKRHAANVVSMGHQAVLLRHSMSNPNREGFREYYSLDDVLENEKGIDGAIVCSPTTKHLDDVRRLVRRNIPFLLEKPTTDKLRSTGEMKEILESMQFTIYDIGFNLRYHPIIKCIKDFLPNAGKVYATKIYVGYYLPYWRKGIDYRESTSAKKELGGGVHVELAHDIDYTLWLIGLPEKVVGYVNRVSDLEISTDDICSAMMKYRDGSVVELHLDYLSHKYLRGGQIIAENGTLEWQWSPAEGSVTYCDKGSPGSREIFATGPGFDFNTTYTGELEHFIGILNGSRKTTVDIADAIETMKVIKAIEVSDREERWIAMEEIVI